MWVVKREFADRADGLHCYEVGDSYPRKGLAEDESRIKELAKPRWDERLGKFFAFIEETGCDAGISLKPVKASGHGARGPIKPNQ